MKKRSKIIYLGALVLILIVWFFMGKHMRIDVSDIGEPTERIETIFGHTIPFNGINSRTIMNTWLVMLILVLISISTRRRLKKIPNRFQVIIEGLVGELDIICSETLGRELGRKYLAFIGTIFIFVLISNWIGIIPIMGIEEPTRDLNTTLGLGIICFFVAHIGGIKYKGWKGYLKEYIEPGGIIGIVMLPLNIVGEFAKVGSHSIRLFGNIMGGSILILVLLSLTKQLFPVYFIFKIFFGIFVGLIQAFVFAMLALTYIAVKVD